MSSGQTTNDQRRARPKKNSDGSNDEGNSNNSNGTGERRRGKITAVACVECRKRKTKCDGRRPVCSKCAVHNKSYCTYDVADGISRYAQLKVENQTLTVKVEGFQLLLNALRSESGEVAHDILSRLRAGEHENNIIELLTKGDASGQEFARGSSEMYAAHATQYTTTSDKASHSLVTISTVTNSDQLPTVPSLASDTAGKDIFLGRLSPSRLDDNSGSKNFTQRVELENHVSSVWNQNGCLDILHDATLKLHELKQRTLISERDIYRRGKLPPRDVILRLACIFVRSTENLFFTRTIPQVEKLVEDVYDDSTPSPIQTAELFCLAASGCHYDVACMHERDKSLYFASSVTYLQAATDAEYKHTMRLLLGLSMYLLLEKNLVASELLHAGISVGRLAMAETVSSDDHCVEAFHTLIVTESWLSSISVRPSAVQPHELSWASGAASNNPPDLMSAIRLQASRLCLLTLEMRNAFSSVEDDKTHVLKVQKDALLTYYNNLPDGLQLSGLVAGNTLVTQQRTSILMIHMMYCRAVILLRQQALSSTAKTHIYGTDGPNLPIDDITACRADQDEAARKLATVIGTLGFDGLLTRRCWLIIDMASCAGMFVMLSVAQNIMYSLADGVVDDLKLAENCIGVLEYCSPVDERAAVHLGLLKPVYNRLQLLYEYCCLGREGYVDPSLFEGFGQLLDAEDEIFLPSPMQADVRSEAIPVVKSILCAIRGMTNLEGRLYF